MFCQVIPTIKLVLLLVVTILKPFVNRLLVRPATAVYKKLCPPLHNATPRVHPEPRTIPPPTPPPTPSGMASWSRDKFSTRRHLYMLERELVEEVAWDAKSSKAGLLEGRVRDSLNHSHQLLLDEIEDLYETWYDQETTLAILLHELAHEQAQMQSKTQRLQKLRDLNAQLEARLGVEGRKQGVPDEIRRLRDEMVSQTTASQAHIAESDSMLIELEMMLQAAEAQ